MAYYPTIMETGSRVLELDDIDAAASILAQAFVDDPLVVYMLPRRRSRLKTVEKFFRVIGEIGIRHGRGFGAGDPLQAVAFWEFPDRGNVSISVKGLGKFVPLLFTQYPIGLIRARAVLRETDALHAKHAPEPHFYLDNLGVMPSAQGRGLSSKLIRPVLALADSQRVPVYTDTVTQGNVSLYEHFGFRCLAANPVANTGITVFALKRAVQE
jgi:ribosomal protein S18 acetylase RimI-like enzyme